MIKTLCKCCFFALAATVAVSASAADGPMTVFVSILPQQTFVQQIGKDLVDVQVMVPPGASPATYEPKPTQMVKLAGSSAYFSIGVPFERAWLEKISAANPDMAVVATDEGIEKRLMKTHHDHDEHGDGDHGEGHEHGDSEAPPETEHEHEKDESGGFDPHVWLSPPLVKQQAETIAAALKEIDPAHGSVYEDNYRDFAARVDELDRELRDTLRGHEGLQFMVFHPSWGYFADAYGLEQVSIEIEGKDPKPAQLQELIEHARQRGIEVIFVQPQFSTKSAELIAREIGGRVFFADPLAADWFANMRTAATAFREALR